MSGSTFKLRQVSPKDPQTLLSHKKRDETHMLVLTQTLMYMYPTFPELGKPAHTDCLLEAFLAFLDTYLTKEIKTKKYYSI